jgi:hypothetical protein
LKFLACLSGTSLSPALLLEVLPPPIERNACGKLLRMHYDEARPKCHQNLPLRVDGTSPMIDREPLALHKAGSTVLESKRTAIVASVVQVTCALRP